MAIQWGPEVGGSTYNRYKIGVDVTATTSLLTVNVYIRPTGAWGPDSVSFSLTGSVVDTVAASYSAAQYEEKLLFTRTAAITAGASYSGTVTMTGGVWGGTPTVSYSGAAPVSAPAAPTPTSVVRTSDTQHTVNWSLGATSGAPYQSQQVQRRVYDGAWSGWATVATLSGSATSYTDSTTAANRIIEWRIVAINSAGTATSTEARALTTPAPPTSVVAARSELGDIVVTVGEPSAPYNEKRWTIEHSPDGGSSWSVLATDLDRFELVQTHVAPSPSDPHVYRARTYNEQEGMTGDGLASTWVASNAVVLTAAPNAPTGLGPSAPGDATEARTLVWTHNSSDTSPQSKYQVRYRVDGGAWVELSAVTSAAGLASLAGGTWSNPSLVEWQVRTWGAHVDPSPYSATAAFALSARPTATISSPDDGGTVDASAVTVGWAYYDAESTAQTAWRAELLGATGTVVEALSGAGIAGDATFATVLANGSAWTVRVQVADAAGLWSDWDSASFTVDYALPPTPTLAHTWDAESGRVYLTATAGAPAVGEVDIVHVDVYRSIDNGPWVKIITGAEPGAVVPDYAPTVAGSNRYRADAVSALPSVSTSAEVEVVTPQAGDGPGAVWLSVGPAFAQACRGVGNVSRTATADLVTRTVRRYAGRTRALEVAGAQAARSWGVSLDYAPSVTDIAQSTPEQWLALAVEPGPFLLRNPDGLYVYVSASGMATKTDPGGAVTGVSFTAVEVEGPAEVAYTTGRAVIGITDNGDGTVTLLVESAALSMDGETVLLTV